MEKTSTSQQRHPADHRVRPNPRKRQGIRAETLEDSSEESLLELRITGVSHSTDKGVASTELYGTF